MKPWQPAALENVLSIFEEQLSALDLRHRRLIESLRVTPRRVPIVRHPGEFVWAVAEHEGKILYWSDVEEGWELEAPDAGGALYDRGCNQLELGQIAHRVFGASA